LLRTYPTLDWETAREVARASRSYRQALWIADADSNLTWLLLVAAAETAANEWARLQRKPDATPRELLESLRPDFADRLRNAAGPTADRVLDEVGATLIDVLKSQWKFLNFLVKYGATPIEPRPKGFAIDWNPKSLKRLLGAIYTYRSLALHTSKPFPPPLCSPPFPSESLDGAPALGERPGGAAYTQGGLWTDDDLPMMLHTFEHIVRTAVLAWWAELASERAATEGTIPET
jgi:hypothetical protein